MAWWQVVLEIIKVTVPALIVFLTVYFLMKEYFKKEYNMRMLEYKRDGKETTLPLRLQAYERLALYCERVRVENLINRLPGVDASPELLKNAMVISLQQEYEHNIAQQVYVSESLWKIVKLAKNQIIVIITQVYEALPENATTQDFKMALIAATSKLENPLDTALVAIKKEAGILLG